MIGLRHLKNERFTSTDENLKKYFSVNKNPKAFDSPYFQKMKEEEEWPFKNLVSGKGGWYG